MGLKTIKRSMRVIFMMHDHNSTTDAVFKGGNKKAGSEKMRDAERRSWGDKQAAWYNST